MTIDEFLRQAALKLETAGVGTARLDVLILLEDVLGIDRAHLLAHPEKTITSAQIAKLNTKITQRSKHIPLAYIRGHAPFYGRDFRVTKHVLIPRPESEAIVDLIKKIKLPRHPRLADIGTGSGCLGITAALELPDAHVELYDIDPLTLEVARHNARSLYTTVDTKQADLLAQLSTTKQYDIVLANLPYVPNRYLINHAAAYEPRRAIFAGADGMDLYRHFWEQIRDLPHPPLHVVTEALPPQHELNDQLAQQAEYHRAQTDGLAQHYSLSSNRT